MQPFAAATPAAPSPRCAGCWPRSGCWTTPTPAAAHVSTSRPSSRSGTSSSGAGSRSTAWSAPETYAALTGAHWRLGDRVLAHESGQLLTGDDVTALQTQLMELGYHLVRADGVFGPLTAEALRSFQRDYGLVADGICGPATLRALRQLGRRVVGGRPQLLRDLVAVADAGPSLLGKRLVLDPGHGGADRGRRRRRPRRGRPRLGPRVPPGGAADRPRRADLADPRAEQRRHRRAAGRAGQRGRRRPGAVPARRRVRPRRDANGVAAYYFGAGESSSTIGERLADLAQREIVARTGLLRQSRPRQDLGACCDSPACPRCESRSAT